jgi:hypothetical protein
MDSNPSSAEKVLLNFSCFFKINNKISLGNCKKKHMYYLLRSRKKQVIFLKILYNKKINFLKIKKLGQCLDPTKIIP